MTVSITLNGALTLDQTAGEQDDDVNLDVTVVDPGDNNDVLTGGLDSDFLAFINGLANLTDAQKAYAATVEGASDADFVTVSATANEMVSRLFLSDSSGLGLNGDQLLSSGDPVQTINGDNIYLWSVIDGSIVLATTSNVSATSGSVVGAFRLEANADNTIASLESVSFIALAHPDENNPDDTIDFGSLIKVSAIVSTTPVLEVDDDGPTAPTITVTSSVTEDETAGVQNTSDPNAQNDVAAAALPASVAALFAGLGTIGFAASTAPLVTLTGGGFGTDGPAASDSVTYNALVVDGTFSGLSTVGGTQIYLYNGTGAQEGAILGRVATEAGTTDTANPAGAIAFAVVIDPDTGIGYIAHNSALNHGTGGTTAAAFDNEIAIATSAIQVTVTYTDHDGDQATSDPVAVGSALRFQDDGPTVTTSPVAQTLTNGDPITGTAAFAYNVGTDTLTNADYTAGDSDFVDTNNTLAGVQINLTGFIDPTEGNNSNITGAVVTRTAETTDSATFSVAFDYDGNPLLAGVQNVHETGTLTFDKNADTYSVTLDDPIGNVVTTTTILHTSGLIAKQPTGNSGHPPIVVEQLTPNIDPDPFFVQFTANSNPNGNPYGFNLTGDGAPTPGDTAFNGADHDMATTGFEDWVSATQTTNGVAGDTIQKGELLTLRFFGENILGDVAANVEKTDPTTTADGVAIEFDGIGASEDLIVFLDLIDANGNEITRAITVDNGDLIKGTAPAPYGEFSLDNNDALLVIEHNDYNFGAETYEIQGMQIMQSANGLTGNGINLNGGVGSTGGSSLANTQSFTAASFGNEQDVLKIVDIGFIQTETTVTEQDAHLDFTFQIADGDNDLTGVQTIHLDILA